MVSDTIRDEQKRSIKVRRLSVYVNVNLHSKVHNSVIINVGQLSMDTTFWNVLSSFVIECSGYL